MKSKEVVNSVLNHEEPEYIPLGTYLIDCDTAEKILGHETYLRDNIKQKIAFWEGRRDEVVQSLKEDCVSLFKKLDCIDVITFKEAHLVPPANYVPPKVKKIDDLTWKDEDNKIIYRMAPLTNDIIATHTEKKKYKKEEFEMEPDYKKPDSSIFEVYNYLLEHLSSERFIAGMAGGFSPVPFIGGMEQGLLYYSLKPELIQNVVSYRVKLQNYLDQYYIKDKIDQVFIESDFSSTNGPLISPQMFRKFCFSGMKKRVNNIKKYCDKVIMHSCGNTWELMDMFIEAGIDCYQSLQTGAGMDIKNLKEKYGNKMSFWGGVSVENLISGTPEEVRKDVRYAIKHGTPNGGFVLGPSHSIAFGTKYDNFMALLDEHDKLKYI